ncbi:MAG: hypothetical protein ABIS08_10810 [Pseudolysinimonas sp.]
MNGAFESLEAETDRIIRTGTIWTAAAIVAPALILGPLLGSGWRPAQLPGLGETFWWIGTIAAAVGVALLIWAGCPVLGFPLAQANAQKIFSIRVGIAAYASGMALAGLAVLIVPGATIVASGLGCLVLFAAIFTIVGLRRRRLTALVQPDRSAVGSPSR